MKETNNWKLRTLLIGTGIGALIGLLGGVILIQRAKRNDAPPELGPGEGVKLGLGILGVLKLLTDIGK